MESANINVLICGGRDYKHQDQFDNVMSHYRNLWVFPIKVICGYDPEKSYPPGADKMAYEMAKGWGLAVDTYPYHYSKGKKGGSTRNQQMLDEGKPDIVIAFPTDKSRGTWDMVRRAKKAGIQVVIV